MHICTTYHFRSEWLNPDQPQNLCAKLCSKFQRNWLETLNEGFAFNYTPFVFRASRTCRDDDGHRKRKNLDYQPGTADAGVQHAHF